MPSMRPFPTRAIVTMLVVFCLVAPQGAHGDAPAPRPPGLEKLRAGTPLDAALETLRGLGLNVFYTSFLVSSSMRVENDIHARTPRVMLDEVLAPHDLHVEDGPGGRLVVVAGPPPPSLLLGQVRSRADGTPVAGAEIVRVDGRRVARSDGAGQFELSLAPGRHELEARLPGFVVGHFEVEVAAGEEANRDIALEAAPVSLDSIIVTPSRISLMRDNPITALDFDRREIFQLPHFGDDIFRALTLLPSFLLP